MISDVTIQRALAAIKSPQELDYFFRALKSPEWIDPLRKEGLFARADPPLQSGDGVEYVRWAPSAYLRRMAPSAPSRVTEVFEKMDIGDNP